MKTALFPGSFDPFTLGHLNIVKRSCRIFDKTIVAVLNNHGKNPLFMPEERVSMIKKCLEKELDASTYDVISFDGLTVDAAIKCEANTIVRAIRNANDLDYEVQLEKMNKLLEPKLDVVYFCAETKYEHISSSILKEIAILGRDVGEYLPYEIAAELKEKLNR